MAADRDGQVLTFYSYKGGTGRTMALANVAWILAANGKRVLMVDWDLESPGLDRFFTPFMKPNALSSTNGVIELIREYEWAASRDPRRHAAWYEEFAGVHRYSFSLDWPHFPGDGALDFLSAGRQNRDYAVAIAGINWDDFYERQGGGAFFDALRADMKRNYDYTLIDSRTGHSDVADICTIHLPDVLVNCFTLSEQCIDGAVEIAGLVRNRSERAIRIVPVPMRVDPAAQGRAEAGRRVAKRRFAGLPDVATEAERDAYWSRMQIPYRHQYGYEESLAAFGDAPGDRDSLLFHYEMLTHHLTDGTVSALPAMDAATRRRINERFARSAPEPETEVVLRYAPIDQDWAAWIGHVLSQAGVRVLDPRARPDVALGAAPDSARILRIVSRTDGVADAGAEDHDPLVVYVTDLGSLHRNASPSVALIAELDAPAAARRIRALVGGAATGSDAAAGHTGPRFPGRGR